MADFHRSDFSRKFSDMDRMNALPRLAQTFYVFTDCESSDAVSRKIAIRLAEEFLPIMRDRVTREERAINDAEQARRGR